MGEQENRLERLKKRLYSRQQPEGVFSRRRRDLHERDFGVAEEWSQESVRPRKNKVSLVKVLLIAAVVFFVGSALLSSFFYFQVDAISPKNVMIDIKGPASIGGGDALSLQIKVTNRNPVPIKDVDLIVEYPEGAHMATDVNTELLRYREQLGTINPGEEVNKTVNSILFGEEGSIKDIKVVIEFRVDTSNAIFFNDTVYHIALATPPLSLVVESLQEAISGQEIVFVAMITSNSREVIKGALFQVEYPFGFEFESAEPKPAFASRLWQLGDILPEEKKKITFRGTLIGQDGEERVFRFAAGIQNRTDPNTLGTAFINTAKSVFVKRPFVSINLVLNGNSNEEVSADGGQSIRGDIIWTNNLPTQIFDTEIEAELLGTVLNKSSITVDRGFYQSGENKILWNRQTDSALAEIPAGGSGRVGFTFSPFGIASGIAFRNPTINIKVNVKAKRLSDTQVPEEIISTLARTVKVNSNLSLTSQILYSTGPFQNTGSLPPSVEQPTTYTISWTVTNSSNQVSDAQVAATLPPYVEWVGAVSPSDETVSYNPIGGQVLWRLGEVSPGVGTATLPRGIAFQIRFVPSLSQVGKVPVLINNQTLSGVDRFTNSTLTHSRTSLTTRLNEFGNESARGVVVP